MAKETQANLGFEKQLWDAACVLPKVYANPDLDKKVLGDVVDLFTNNLHMEGSEEDQDLLGRTYEYCIAQFAAKEGKGGGEFYTPGCVVRTLVEVLKPFENCRIYEIKTPFLIQIATPSDKRCPGVAKLRLWYVYVS